MRSTTINTSICAAIIAGVFGFDRITKFFALRVLPETGTLQLLGRLVGLTRHHNFGLLADLPFPRWVAVMGTGFIVVALLWKSAVDLRRMHPTVFPLALIVGGALGNLYDRAFVGFVFDWILLFQRSVINVADIAIAVGIVWFVSSSRAVQQTSGKEPTQS